MQWCRLAAEHAGPAATEVVGLGLQREHDAVGGRDEGRAVRGQFVGEAEQGGAVDDAAVGQMLRADPHLADDPIPPGMRDDDPEALAVGVVALGRRCLR